MRWPFARPDGRHVYHLFVVRVGDKSEAMRAHLSARGVGNGVYYPVPLHLQKCFAYLGYTRGDFPMAEAAAAETIALPMYPELSDAQLEFVVSAVTDFFR
ncbi:MAG TPA: DegT/DnrJ/EryC1/StrS family aminotransferase [Chthoniobacterales bacterium]